MTPADIYARAKAALEEIERAPSERRDWSRFGNELLVAIMKCQSIVMDRQRTIMERARVDAFAPQLVALRVEAKDAMYYLDQLTALYERIKAQLRPPTR